MSANNYEEKSDKTFDSAELLFDKSHNNSSIHSYYYSCIQLVNNFIVKHCGYTEAELIELTKDKESHNKTFTIVKEFLHDTGLNPVNAFSELNLIKKQRIKADYRMSFVVKNEAEVTRKKTIYFRQTLKSYDDEI